MAIVHACAGLLVREKFLKPEDYRSFFEHVRRFCPSFIPYRYGPVEPLEFSVDESQPVSFASYYDNSIIWTTRQGSVEGMAYSDRDDRHSGVFSWGKPSSFDVVTLKEFLQEIEDHYTVDLAYIHLLTMQEIELHRKDYRYLVAPFNCGVCGIDLLTAIPNMPWAAVFGAPYVEAMGAKAILQCQAYRVEEWKKSMYVQVSESLDDVDRSFDEFERKRCDIKRSIGERFFFLGRNCRSEQLVPRFSR